MNWWWSHQRVRQTPTETEVVHALGVVVLVPEQRQQDHRRAEVERLGRRVVAAVSDDRVDLRDDRGLRQELCADHVVGELVEVGLRPLAHDEAVRCATEHIHEPLHEVDVGAAE